MNEIIEILIRRDNNTFEEAERRFKECKERIENEAICTGDSELAEEILMSELGLEPDYLIELI